MWNIIEGVRNKKYFLLLLLLGKTLTPLTPYSYSPALDKCYLDYARSMYLSGLSMSGSNGFTNTGN